MTDAEKKEAERRKQTMEELTATVVNLEIKLQQEKVSAMADGRRKTLEEVEIEKEERLKAIDDEEKERKKKYASVGKEMPEKEKEIFVKRRMVIKEEAEKKETTVNKEYDRQEIDFQKELSSVFLTEEEKRKQAIRDRYDEMRRLREEAFQGEIGNIKDSELGEKEKAEAIADATAKYLETLSTIGNAQSFEENKDKKEQYDALIAQLDDYNCFYHLNIP